VAVATAVPVWGSRYGRLRSGLLYCSALLQALSLWLGKNDTIPRDIGITVALEGALHLEKLTVGSLGYNLRDSLGLS